MQPASMQPAARACGGRAAAGPACLHLRAPCRPLARHAASRAPSRLVVARSAKAAELLAEAKQKYEAGDRMTAMRMYESVLGQASLTTSQRLAAMYGTLAVHASFGDVELAQMALRDGVQAGLDFEAALKDPTLVEINSSPQILIQLSRFNKQLLRSLEKSADERESVAAASAAARRRAGGRSSSQVPSDMDLSALLGPADKSEQGLDASPAAIAKRVALVLLAGIGLGVGLFYFGLQFMFPPSY